MRRFPILTALFVEREVIRMKMSEPSRVSDSTHSYVDAYILNKHYDVQANLIGSNEEMPNKILCTGRNIYSLCAPYSECGVKMYMETYGFNK